MAADMSVADALEAAAAHHQAGRLDDAERLCDAVIAALPDNGEALHRRGVLAFQRGAFDHAADLLRRAVAVDATAPEPHNSLGNILLAAGDHEGAAACYGRSLALTENAEPGIRVNLGVALYGLGEHDAAEESLEDALAHMPDHAQARAALGMIALDRGDDAHAAAQLRAAALLDPRYAYGTACVLGDDLDAYTDASGLAEMIEAAPSLEGALPVSEATRPVVVTACDHRYFRRFARALAASVQINAPGCDLHIHAFNPEPGFDEEVATLGTGLATTQLTVSRETAPGADPVYFSNMRAVRLHQIMAACGRRLIALDTDSLVRGPLDGLDAALDGCDMAVTLRPDRAEIAQKWLATTLVLEPTASVRDLLNGYHEDRLAWRLDQCVLYLVHRQMTHEGSAPSLAPLPNTYADSGLAPDSTIWAAKGERKTAPAFVAEAAGYAIPGATMAARSRRAAGGA
jgi:tetratricopeptide (TPR) repeat protein